MYRIHPWGSEDSILWSQNLTSFSSSSFCCTPAMCKVHWAIWVWYKDAHYWDWVAMLPETLTSAPVVSMTHQNQVPSHLTGHLAHWQQSPSTCSFPYYLVSLFIQDESLGPPFIQEVFLAIPMPQTPVGTPPLCLYSSQLAGMEVGVYLSHSVLSASNTE